ncbi:MAG: hypothetical protein WCA07_00740 [Gloeobacterales cyanobacterium]
MFFSAQLHHHIQQAKAHGMTALQSEVIHTAVPYIVRATLLLGDQTFQAHGQQDDLLVAENMAMERVFALAGLVREGGEEPLGTVSSSALNVTPIRPMGRIEPIEQSSEAAESIPPTQTFETRESELDFDIPVPEEEEFSLTPLPPLDEPDFYSGGPEESGDTKLPSALHDQLLEQLMEQTTQEIRRIGMNNNQGRTYLKNSYGKPTRQELTLAELKSFLSYLKSQPSKK